MRIRVLRLPPQVADAIVGVPYVLLLDRLGEDVLTAETVEHLRDQIGARAVFASGEDIELEDLGAADEEEYERLLIAMQIAAGDTDESDLNVL